MKWYLKVLKQYADFSGRASRKEYWMFTLFNIIFIVVAMILTFIIGSIGYGLSAPSSGSSVVASAISSIILIVTAIYLLAIILPGLSVSIRRLHDTGKSGWMILVSLIPIAGAIWLLVFMVADSQQGTNKWGENPKEIIA